MALNLVVNGHKRTFETLTSGSTVTDLVAVLELVSDRIALELNDALASRTGWGVQLLQQGDKVEIVHFVGGG